jgi:hypothetical protein
MSSTVPAESGTVEQLLGIWRHVDDPPSVVADLVHLQTLILMAMATTAHGPSYRPKSPFLGAAIDVARSMKLRFRQVDSAAGDESNSDLEDKAAVRAWWTLVMLDRWRAVGAADETMIHNDSVVIVTGLKSVLGEAGYSLIRESIRIRCTRDPQRPY